MNALNSVLYNPMTLNLLTAINKGIYTNSGNKINETAVKIIKIVGGVGGSLFTLAIMIIAVVIIFGSISSKKIGTVWMALFSCIGGALLFYSAYFLAPTIAGMV